MVSTENLQIPILSCMCHVKHIETIAVAKLLGNTTRIVLPPECHDPGPLQGSEIEPDRDFRTNLRHERVPKDWDNLALHHCSLLLLGTSKRTCRDSNDCYDYSCMEPLLDDLAV